MNLLNINPSEAVPIWKQIEDEVRRLIAAGTLASGEVVPSVRELARQLRINPATVAKAYQGLVDAGILVIRRGDGTYVSDQLPTVKKTEKAKVLREGAMKLAAAAITVGACHEETQQELTSAFKRLGKPAGGNGHE